MSINWYPGHMHKARKAILDVLNSIDVLIEIVDARLPYSSQNPTIGQWRQTKPTIVILSKTDLADPAKTAEWQQHFEQQDNIKTLAYHKGDKSKLKQISELCLKLAPEKSADFKPVNAMIVGIPNVGKSTLINAISGKNIAKVGDEPAVTKQQQKIYLDNNVILHDTPGILWPKIENPNSGYRLAIMGSIKNTAIEYDDIGFYAADYLIKTYPDKLCERYQLEETPSTEVDCLEALGRKRGARQAGGRINLHKACEILIHDIRAGELGNITLETPTMVEKEVLIVEAERVAKEKKKAEQKAEKKKAFKKRNG
ncbi:MAG: ribosome biogenesis GTPase YlqF [Cellvibrionaceae bacterium]